MAKLHFEGKQHIYAHHMTVPVRALVPVAAKSVAPLGAASAAGGAPPPDGNLIIHGDNLLALKSLLPRYEGRVNCIYIDPPYNTGNEGWVYNDRVNSPLMRGWLAENGPVDGEDLLRHDKWLCMMWPRLHLLHALLADDGVIFVSIDDNEQHHLRMLLDEIFGEENFVADIVWQHRHGRSNNAKLISNQREHIIFYRKSDAISRIRTIRDEQLDETYSNPDNDPRGAWVSSSYVNPATKEQRPNLVYSVLNPRTGGVVDHPTHAWKYSRVVHEEHVKDDRLWWGANGDMRYPRLKNFLSESNAKGIVPVDLLLADVAGTTDEGTRELQAAFQSSNVDFNNPKPTKLIRKLIAISEGNSGKDSLVLDSFAGSGTTAHAVLALNKEDGGNRRFILVECEDYADTTTAERVRRVISGVPGARDADLRDGLGGEFTYCELGGPIDMELMLTGEGELPSYESLAAYLLLTATGRSAGEGSLAAKNDDGLFHSTDATDYYLLYQPDAEWLEGEDGILRLSGAKRIAAALQGSESPDGRRRNAVVFGVGRYIKQDDLTPMGITFCQIPYETRLGA